MAHSTVPRGRSSRLQRATYGLALPTASCNLMVSTSGGGCLATDNSCQTPRWRNGKALTLTQRNGLPCEQVYAIAFDERGDLWLYMNCALGVLARADFQVWKQNPDIAVTIRTLDALDGVRPSPAAFVAAARSLDGRLWFANSVSLQFVDTEHLRQNTVPPPVYIEQVVADRTAYPAQGILQLPPRTRDLEIDYVGLSFVAPQKVRFRYRLHGRMTYGRNLVLAVKRSTTIFAQGSIVSR